MKQKKTKSKKNLVFKNNQNNVILVSGYFPDSIEKLLKETLEQFQYVIEEGESYADPSDFKWFSEATEELNNGKIISALRYHFSLSQGDLGKKIGVSRKYISDMENGRRKISLNMAKKLGEVFNHNPKDFIHFGKE